MSSDEDVEFDEDGNFRTHEDDDHLSDSETDLDEDGFPIVEDPAIVGDGDFTLEGEPEPLDAYADLFGEPTAKRHKATE